MIEAIVAHLSGFFSSGFVSFPEFYHKATEAQSSCLIVIPLVVSRCGLLTLPLHHSCQSVFASWLPLYSGVAALCLCGSVVKFWKTSEATPGLAD